MKFLKKWFTASIRRQILIPFLSLIIVSCLLVSVLSYQSIIKVTTTEQTRTTAQQVQALNGSFEIFFENMESTINRLSVKDELNDSKTNRSAIMKEFEQTTEHNSSISSSYIGVQESGETLIYPKVQLPNDFDPRERDWYQLASKNSGEIIWTQPYLDTATGKMIVTLAKTVSNNNSVTGVIGIDISLETLTKMINQTKLGNSGFAFLLDQNGHYMAHRDSSKVTTNFSKDPIYKAMSKKAGSLVATYDGKEKLVGYVTNELTGWKIVGLVDKSEIIGHANTTIIPNLLLLGLILVLAIVLSIFATRSITKPVQKLRNIVQKMAEGDFTVKVDIDRKDEIGQLADGFNTMSDAVHSTLKKVKYISDEVAESSMTLVASAEENSAASIEVATTMEQIASGATNQTELIQSNEIAIQSISDHIQNIENHAQKMAIDADKMSEASETGRQTVLGLKQQFNETAKNADMMSKAVNSLDTRSQEINDIIRTITDIAGQTNLLALNAAIEAARAGEHGKGFAVVADEVKKLAEQTDHSTKEIADIISTMQTETSSTVRLIDVTGQQIKHQGEVVIETEQAFHSIATIINETFSGFGTITDALHDMIAQLDQTVANSQQLISISQETAAGTEEVAASIEQTAASMEQLNKLANDLESISHTLHDEIKKFQI